jgi:hypothetical protein
MSEALQQAVDAAPHKRNQARIDADMAELEALMKGMTGEQESEEVEPDSEEPEAEPVQAESDTEQEEEHEDEAQEDDDEELSAEEKNFKKRYGDIRRHLQKKEEEYSSRIEELEAQLSKAANNELVLPKTDEEIEEWASQYPDVASIIETIADKKSKSAASELEERISEIEEMRAEARREKAEAELFAMHSDFEEIRSDDAFHNWADEQPKWVQDALYENVDDAKSVSRVIDLYKADKGIKKKVRAATDKAAAASVKTKGATPEADDSTKYLSESMVDKMSMTEYEKRKDEIMEAQRSGKFIYDITRK